MTNRIDQLELVETWLDEPEDALVAVSREGTVLFCSGKAASIFDCDRWTAVGRPLRDLLGEDSVQATRLEAALERAMTTGAAVVEISTIHADQATTRSVALRTILDPTGAIEFVNVRFRDVTMLRRLQDEFVGEALTRGLLEAAPDAMVIVGADGSIVLVNGQLELLFGYARDELLGRPIELLVPDRFRHAHPAHRDDYFANARARPMAKRLALDGRRRDGSEFPAEISLAPVLTDDGMLVTAAIRDVTERRKADEARFRLAAIVDSTEDAIVSNTLTGKITSWNAGAERTFGYSADEILGKSIAVLIPEDRLAEEARTFERLERGERVGHYETRRRLKDGRIIDVSVTISLILDAASNVVGASTVARDISDQKRAERSVARAKEAAETANRELEAFSYSVAHDLRGPLRGIDGFSLVLLEDYSDRLDAGGKELLVRVRESAQHMAELIENLLMLARVSRSEIRHDRVDLSAIAQSAARRLRNGDPDRDLEFVVTDGLVAEGDTRLLGIVFDNLLGNAWKFTSKRTAARVEFGRTQHAGSSAYFVRDNGAGFDMAYSSKLFGAFQRLHGSGEFEGTGIGLATVQRIVHRHGGRIWAEAEVERGATFYFTLGENHPT